jgi:hypothetical protein
MFYVKVIRVCCEIYFSKEFAFFFFFSFEEEFGKYLKYVRNLDFFETPNVSGTIENSSLDYFFLV